MSSNDIEALVILVKANGKIYQVMTSDENKDTYLRTIAVCEDGVKIIDKPLDNLIIEKKEQRE